MIRRVFLVLLAGACAVPFPAGAGEADAVVARVKARLTAIETLSCSFRREQVWKAADRTHAIAGTIRLKKPYKLRVEYSAQTIVVDGKTAWTYTPRNRQVTVTTFRRNDAEYPTPKSIFERYSGRKAEFLRQEAVAGRAADVIRLVPASPDEADVTVWIDRERSFPVKSVEKTANGDVVTSILTDVVINGKIPEGVFTFTAPAGVSVVDMRK